MKTHMKLAIGAAWVAGLLEMAALWRSRVRTSGRRSAPRMIAGLRDSALKRRH